MFCKLGHSNLLSKTIISNLADSWAIEKLSTNLEMAAEVEFDSSIDFTNLIGISHKVWLNVWKFVQFILQS